MCNCTYLTVLYLVSVRQKALQSPCCSSSTAGKADLQYQGLFCYLNVLLRTVSIKLFKELKNRRSDPTHLKLETLFFLSFTCCFVFFIKKSRSVQFSVQHFF